MPAVVRMGEQLFLDDFYDDVEDSPIQNQLLSTIRVPKNLLYLTDRLPKPMYQGSTSSTSNIRNRSNDEETKRRTQEPPDQKRLPDIPKNAKQRSVNKQQMPLSHRNPGSGEEPVAQSQALPSLKDQKVMGSK